MIKAAAKLLALTAALGLGLASVPAYTQTAAPLDSLQLGKNRDGDPCTAKRTWDNPHISRYDLAYAITCRGAVAGRIQGVVFAINSKYAKARDDRPCGASKDVEVKGLGTVSARQCYDSDLGIKVVEATFRHNGVVYIADSAFSVAGPLETALKTLSGVAPQVTDRYQTNDPALDGSTLPEAPTPQAAAVTTVEPSDRSFDPSVTLAQGIDLNRQGAFNEASQTLNAGLSRLTKTTSDYIRADFLLEAGLADSNIGLKDSARGHFLDGENLLAQGARGDKTHAYLVRKLSTYEALDFINQRRWTDALQALRVGDIENAPLLDPSVVNQLNQAAPATKSSHATMNMVDKDGLSLTLLEAERNWATSVALLGTGDRAASEKALQDAVDGVNLMQANVSADSLISIKALIQRQYGRLQGNSVEAVASFDCALAMLQGGRVADPSKCVFQARGTTNAATLSGPIIAETELERAGAMARAEPDKEDDIVAAYATAIDSLLASSSVGERQTVDLEPYFDILVKRYAADPNSTAPEDFFHAIQAIGEPAVAQQIAQLQSVVTADPALAAKVRDRSELQRRVIQLRYQIASGVATNPADLAAMEGERQKAESALNDIDSQLSATPQIDDRPARISDIKAVLQPGEYYLKVVELKDKAYGIVISRDQTFFYPLVIDSEHLSDVAAKVRASIRDNSGILPFFNVPAAYALYHVIAGPAEASLAHAQAIFVDPSGPLESLPLGVLVTSQDSVKDYMSHVAKTPNDYSHVAFVAANTDIYNALSPRALIISRQLPPSNAPKAFIGFGENAAPPTPTPQQAALMAPFNGCQMTYGDFLSRVSGNKPVSAHEIALAAHELGDDGAPEVTGAAFTDTAMEANSATGAYEQYQVIHFATHGIPETNVNGCDIPPSLITTVAPVGPSGEIVSDGFLSISEIAQLRFDANLVVLSACDTAAGVSGELGRLSGQEDSGRTLDGLVLSFITARARTVMATYWNVPASSETDDLMKRFYNFGSGLSMGRALRAAQYVLIRQPQYSHPYFWGAYVLIGDGSKRMLSPKTAKIASN